MSAFLHVSAWCLKRPEEGSKPSGAAVRGREGLVGTQTSDLCTGSRCYYLPSLLLLLAAVSAAC